MGKHLIDKRFFRENQPQEFSSARFAYSLLHMPDLEKRVEIVAKEKGIRTNDISTTREALDAVFDPSDLLQWLRREIPGPNKAQLYSQVLAHEDLLMPSVLKRILTSYVDVFIENTVNLVVHAQNDYSPWLLAHFDQIRNPYAQSMMCLALGFRAQPDIIPWMMQQFESMKKRYPDDSFSEGPLFGLIELSERFGMD